MTEAAVLSVQNASKSFASRKALDGVSLDVRKGEMIWGHIALKFECRCPIIALNVRAEHTFACLINGISVPNPLAVRQLYFP